MSLPVNQRALVQAARGVAIPNILARVKSQVLCGQWLHPSNRYKYQATKKLSDDLKTNKIVHNDLKEYVAASTVLHALDGWSYLGRSISAAMMGDEGASLHLSYYAELRAALAILATQGVGVFGHIHALIDNAGAVSVFDMPTYGTHKFTWLALSEWSKSSHAANSLINLVCPAGFPIADWLKQFDVGAVATARIAQDWLRDWSIDLKSFPTDRNARNVVSYRPTLFESSGGKASESAQFASDLWKACGPDSYSRFEWIDRHLLRSSVSEAGKRLFGSPASPKHAQQIDVMLGGMPVSNAERATLKAFLLATGSDPGERLLIQAKQTTPLSKPGHHLDVSARAYLLLRVATGFCASALRQAGVTVADLAAWRELVGVSRGLWSGGQGPSDPSDLWADIEPLIDDLDNWLTTNANPSFSELRNDVIGVPSLFPLLGSFERVGLWGARP